MTEERNRIRIGTRRSPLALWQATYVQDQLRAAHPELTIELVPIETRGDQILDVMLSKVGGKGLFVKELEVALLEGRVDLCVHSAKDMPAQLPSGLELVCFPPRADPRDALVLGGVGGIDALPPGARVGTSSLRRQAQLLLRRPDLEMVSVRGNIQTRMRKVEELGLACVVLACAGLDRMAEGAAVAHRLSLDDMLPAAAQGILGIEARADDAWMRERLAPLDDPGARLAALAERAFLAVLGGGCQVPVAAHCVREGEVLWLRGLVARPDGGICVRGQRRGPVDAPEALGRALGEELWALGARELLAAGEGAGLAVPSRVTRASGALTCQGARVCVVRDDAPLDDISRALVAQGAHVVPLPLCQTESLPLDNAGARTLRAIENFDVVAFTSELGVRFTCAHLHALGRGLPQGDGAPRFVAVGPTTAAALRARGVPVDLVGAGGGGALAEAMTQHIPLSGAKVLLPRAEAGNDDLWRTLEQAGADVTCVATYRSLPRPDAAVRAAEAIAALPAPETRPVLLLTSPRRVQVLRAALDGGPDREGGDVPRSLAGVTVLAIGQTTWRACLAAGFPHAQALPSATPDAVCEAVADLLAAGTRR